MLKKLKVCRIEMQQKIFFNEVNLKKMKQQKMIKSEANIGNAIFSKFGNNEILKTLPTKIKGGDDFIITEDCIDM